MHLLGLSVVLALGRPERTDAEGNPDHVLDFGAGNVEVGRDLGEAIAGLEAVDQILDFGAAVDDQRLAECLGGVDRDLSLGCRPLGASARPSHPRRR